jgi:RluA family pseudouridine synthase
VPEGVKGIRFSDYGLEHFKEFSSRKSFVKAVKRGEFRIDGKPATTARLIETGMVIELLESPKKSAEAYRMKLEVIYEDQHLAVIFKPAGIEVSGNKFKTVNNALLHNIELSGEKDALKIPRPVHRLDFPTSGLLLVAKTGRALADLGRQFEEKLVQKRYRAVVMGEIPESGILDNPVNGKKAESEFKLVSRVKSIKSETLSLVDLWPRTGRTHQLRIHLSQAGFPILGDSLYGPEGKILKGKGLFLCAVELNFIHPITKEPISISTKDPDKFAHFMQGEQRRWEKYHNS